MAHRKIHNIESNCVTFDDYCYDETASYYTNIAAIDKKELNWLFRIFNKIVVLFKSF